jgi:non-heme chloroperoxidase
MRRAGRQQQLDKWNMEIRKDRTVPIFSAKDKTEIYYKDWGSGDPILFSHGWPLNADAWDAQMLFFGQQGYRVIAHDRRGHGRSSQAWDHNDYDTWADDLAGLIDQLDMTNLTLIAHSMGGGEIARYVGRHGTSRLAKMVFIGAVPPLMVQTDANPGGLPLAVFDGLRAGLVENRSQFYKDTSVAFFGYNRPNAKVSDAVEDQFWRLGMQSGVKASYDCIEQFSETDFTEDLKKIDVPALFMHGEDDQIVPYQDASVLAAELAQNGTLKVYPGLSHGMAIVDAETINADLLAFVKS